MNVRKVLLIGMLGLGMVLVLGLMGCGSDDKCEDGCNKIFSCVEQTGLDPNVFGGSVEQCTEFCNNDDSDANACAKNCDTGLSCIDYVKCLGGCGV